jgi:hypothetical protein
VMCDGMVAMPVWWWCGGVGGDCLQLTSWPCVCIYVFSGGADVRDVVRLYITRRACGLQGDV